MPRYYISMSDQAQAHDESWLILSGPEELAEVLRQTVATMLHDNGNTPGQSDFAVDAHDAHGEHVMAVKLSMTTLRA